MEFASGYTYKRRTVCQRVLCKDIDLKNLNTRSLINNFILERIMNVIMDLCIVPMGVGVSVSEYVVACHEVLKKAGLKTQLHAYGTNIEGEWDEVMAAVKACHEKVHGMGAPRITTTIKMGTRTDRSQSMGDKITSVLDKLK
jgi:uncharacterized protein (TIGR00106 family)